LITCNCVWLKPCTRICSYKSEWQRACAGKRKGQHTPLFLFFKKLNKCRSTPLGSSSTFISYTISITLQDRRTIPRVIYQFKCCGVHWHALACSGVHWRALACSGVHWLALACCGVHWRALACSGVLWRAVACSGVNWRALAFTGVHWRALACTGVLWRALACSGVL
jgi:hypothetical protein